MKYYVTNEEFVNVVEMLSVVSGKATVINFIFAKKVFSGNNLLCSATSFAGTEQMDVSFMAKAENEDPETEQLAFDGKVFLAVAKSMLAFNDNFYIETAGAFCYLGVTDKLRLPVPVLSQEEVPDRIVMKADELLIQTKISQVEFINALRQGGYMAMLAPDLNGCDNVTFSIQEEGSIYIYSTSGNGIAKSSCGCEIASNVPPKKENRTELDDEIDRINAKTNERRKEYITERSIPNLQLAVPKKVILDLLKVLSGEKSVILAFSSRHLFAAASDSTLFSASLGSKSVKAVFLLDEWMKNETNYKVVVDSAEFGTSLKVMQQAMDAANAGKTPVRLVITAEETRFEATGGMEGEIKMKNISSSITGEASLCFNAEKLSEVVSSLEKGNLKIALFTEGKSPVASFNNGALDGKAGKSCSFLFPVRVVEDMVEKKETTETNKVEE